MVIITQKQTKKREKNDYYPTPEKLVRAMVQHYGAPPHYGDGRYMNILDPGCGDGVFGMVARDRYPKAHIVGVDIIPRFGYAIDKGPYYDEVNQVDFTEYQTDRKFDLVIGNPPFSLAEEFIRHCFDLMAPDGRLVFLIKLAFLESKKRVLGLWQELPPTRVDTLHLRPSFDGSGSTNDYAMAIYIWDKFMVENRVKDQFQGGWFVWR